MFNERRSLVTVSSCTCVHLFWLKIVVTYLLVDRHPKISGIRTHAHFFVIQRHKIGQMFPKQGFLNVVWSRNDWKRHKMLNNIPNERKVNNWRKTKNKKKLKTKYHKNNGKINKVRKDKSSYNFLL